MAALNHRRQFTKVIARGRFAMKAVVEFLVDLGKAVKLAEIIEKHMQRLSGR